MLLAISFQLPAAGNTQSQMTPKVGKQPPVTGDHGSEQGNSGYERRVAAMAALVACENEEDMLEEPSRVIVPSEEYKKGRMAFLFGQYDTAYEIWRPLADDGYAKAQATLGWMYQTGKGVEKHYERAFMWYERAAQSEHSIAQNNLGVLYENGWGVSKNHQQAAHWYRQAAESGYAYAQYNLGMLYINGKGVKQDETEARYWLQIATLQGIEQARDELRTMLEKAHKKQQISREQAKTARKKTKTPRTTTSKIDQPVLERWFSEASAVVQPQESQEGQKKTNSHSAKVYNDEWVKEQKDALFTLQLASSDNLPWIISMIRAYPLVKEVAHFKESNSSQTSYNLIYGLFNTKEDARAAVNELPKALKEHKPRVRKLKDIKKAIYATELMGKM